MPPARKRTTKSRIAMCSNHPERRSVWTTGGLLHQPISLCEACLTRIGVHIQEH